MRGYMHFVQKSAHRSVSTLLTVILAPSYLNLHCETTVLGNLSTASSRNRDLEIWKQNSLKHTSSHRNLEHWNLQGAHTQSRISLC